MQDVIEFICSYPKLAQMIGVTGFLIYITSFFSVQSGHLCGNGILFPVLQVIAASCVLTSLASAYNLASFMIQISYIAIGLFGIALRLRRVRSGRDTPSGQRGAFSKEHPAPCRPKRHVPAPLFRHTPAPGAYPESRRY